MSFYGYLVLVTVAGVVLRWILFEWMEREGDESFLWFLLDTRIRQDPRALTIMIVYMLVAGGIGVFLVG